MYRHFLQQIVSILGEDGARAVLVAAPPLIIVALLVVGARAGRSRLEALESAPGRWPLVALFVVNFLRLSLGAAGVGFLCLMLLVQAGLFSEQHGRVTQRNYEAVKTKWGAPHEQRELRVRHFVWETVTSEDLANGQKRRIVSPTTEPAAGDVSEKVLDDESFPAALDEKGRPINPTAVVRRLRKRVRRRVSQDSIASAEVKIDLNISPRYLGGAAYAGFEDTCLFRYVVVNRAPHATQAAFAFPLPGGGYGLFDRLSVKEDGKDVGTALRYRDGALRWERRIEAGERVVVEVGYASRGLEYFRYWPGNLRERYVVTMRVRGLPARRLNFPIGSMSPKDDLAALRGEDYTLHWDLSRAVTNYTIGVMVPSPEQPGYKAGRLLKAAPPGLILLVLTLVFSRLVLRARVPLLPLGLTVLASYFGYTAFANFSNWIRSFPVAFAAGMTLPALAGTAFWLVRDGRSFVGVQSAVLYLLFALGYPLANCAGPLTGTILHSTYVALVVYAMFLVAFSSRLSPVRQE